MRTNRAIVAVAAALAAPFGFAGAQQPKPKDLPEGTTVSRDLEYVEKGHARNRLDLYVPKSDRPLPLVVWVHGGAWSAGDKGNPPALFLLQKGFAVASINYRLSQHAVFPAQIEDCKAAVRWLRANAKTHNLNPEKIGAMGSSAGGHLVALLGTSGGVTDLEGTLGNADQSSRVQCVVDLFGPTDFARMGGSHLDPRSPESRLVGGAIPDNKEKAQRANPVAYVTKDDPPFLIIHGDKDGTVPYGQSVLLRDALDKAGVPAQLITVEGGGHGGPGFMGGANGVRIAEFFAKHLQGAVK